jgi:hypothetical protein
MSIAMRHWRTLVVVVCVSCLNDAVSGEQVPEFLPLTQEVVDSFPSLSWSEKVPYIFTEEEWDDLSVEFHQISGSDESRISYEAFIDHFTEFSDPTRIISFWKACDKDTDRHVDMTEYAQCRGDFDQNGDPYDVNEYEFREANLLASFVPAFEYDEDGIIID